MTINEMLEWTDEQLEALTDAQLLRMDYGITYYDFGAAGVTATPRAMAVLDKLQQMLAAAQDGTRRAAETKPPVEMVTCDCGCTVPATVVMTTSRGTACPDCYDRMSDPETTGNPDAEGDDDKVPSNRITTNAAECRDELAPLYKRYPGQTDCQGAYIEIDPQAQTMRAEHNPEIGGAVPFAVYHGRLLRVSVSPYLTGDAVADLLEDERVLQLAEDICDGHTVEWDGSNRVGRLDDDARLALDELERIADRWADEHGSVAVVEIGMWLEDYDPEELRSKSDAEIDDEAERLAYEAESECVIIDEGSDSIADYLRELRDGLWEGRSIDVAEAAELLGVGKRRVQALIKQANEQRALVDQAPIGRQVSGVGAWVLTRAEVELIRPRPTAGRPPKA